MERIRIGDRLVGKGGDCFIIAEVGSNHDGSLEHAYDYVDLAAKIGADAVKFQSFSAANLVNSRWPTGNGGTVPTPFLSTLRRAEVPLEWHELLAARANDRGLIFLSTPFDEERTDLLAAVGVPAFKIASGDLTHEPLLAHVAGYRRPVILSTGLGTIEEIARAIEVIEQAAGWKSRDQSQIVILHCVSKYPAKPESLNLRSLQTLEQTFGLPVGFSDHTETSTAAVTAVALGASVIEKHLTFSKQSAGPDHSFALTPAEFSAMVQDIREVESCLGGPQKGPQPEEESERVFARRGLFAACNISAGSVISREMVKVVRPGIGLEPKWLPLVVGSVAQRRIGVNEPISTAAIEGVLNSP